MNPGGKDVFGRQADDAKIGLLQLFGKAVAPVFPFGDIIGGIKHLYGLDDGRNPDAKTLGHLSTELAGPADKKLHNKYLLVISVLYSRLFLLLFVNVYAMLGNRKAQLSALPVTAGGEALTTGGASCPLISGKGG